MNSRIFDKKEYRERFGSPLKKLLLARWDTVKFAADILNESPTMLSHYFAGRRIPGRKFEDKLRSYGFDLKIFEYIHTETVLQDLPADTRGMTWQQVVWYVEQLKDFIGKQNKTIDTLRSAIKVYEERIADYRQYYK